VKTGFLEKLASKLDRLDSTEVQRIVGRLIQEKGFLENVFEALQEGVVLLDSKGVVLFVNRSAAAFFGLDAGKAVGMPLASQARGLDWETLMRPGHSIHRDLEVFYPERRLLNFYLAPIGGVGDHNDALGYVMLVRDLTRTRAEAEETLESEKLNALTLLAAGVAHEIGNPLNAIDIHMQLAERHLQQLPESDRKTLEGDMVTIRNEIRRLDAILKQFLQAVRPTVPRRERHDLHTLLRDTLKLLEAELGSRGITVELEFAEGMPAALVDEGQFHQAFYNLIRNAYQALPAQSGRITVRTRFNDYEWIISVEDNGIGISPEQMGVLFEPYHSNKPGGNGLGLLIVRRIVREHGGEISIQSQEGKGTEVVIHLPRTERHVRLIGTHEPIIDLN
jgi:two-component system, sporulation sensor kinase E